jgi:hypothetical protein
VLKWNVDVIYDTLCHLAGVPLRSYFLEQDACIAAWRDGRRELQRIYGGSVASPLVGCPHLSYGHLGCLGAPLEFPEDSEPWVGPVYADLESGIQGLERPVDFASHPLFRRYLRTYEALRRAFPGEMRRLGGLGCEGPITTAVLLRGLDFFVDALERPEPARRFLELVTDSIVSFVRAVRRVDALPPVDPAGSGLADDFASFLPPASWPELVLPAWERYYRGLTTGKRTIHIEGMDRRHLPFLSAAGIVHLEPCVSPRLEVHDLVAAGVPFRWLLPSFELRNLRDQEIELWVGSAIRDGATELHTELSAFMLREGRGDRIGAFVTACRRAAERTGAA